jgi:putative phosphoesterase
MRLGLLADVHANLPALEAALDALADADVLLCAGDLVGYGPHPNEVVARLAEAGVRSVAGNHDLVATDAAGLDRCDELAAHTLAWTRAALSSEARAYLEALPLSLDHEDVHVVHGAPGDPWHYVRERADALAQLERVPGCRVLVAGHTHRPLVAGRERRFVNPGAVGQARERRPRVRVALLDGERLEPRCVDYDVQAARDALRAAGLPLEAIHRRPPLRALLLRG